MSDKPSRKNYGSITNIGSVAIGAIGVVYLLMPGEATYENTMANFPTAVGFLMLGIAFTFFGLRRAIAKVLEKLDKQ